jgi:hypothetical protein
MASNGSSIVGTATPMPSDHSTVVSAASEIAILRDDQRHRPAESAAGWKPPSPGRTTTIPSKPVPAAQADSLTRQRDGLDRDQYRRNEVDRRRPGHGDPANALDEKDRRQHDAETSHDLQARVARPGLSTSRMRWSQSSKELSA